MILRRVIDHFRKQEWTAIGIDFLIVVLGVFVGLQVNNWNEARALYAREREQLVAVRADLEGDIAHIVARKEYYAEVAAAGDRALTFLTGGDDCDDKCWPVLLDFFYASQWIDLGADRTAYDEMRRAGSPLSRDLSQALAKYYSGSEALNSIINERPAYRQVIRQLLPVAAQDAMWRNCHISVGDLEYFDASCTAAIPTAAAARAAQKIRGEAEVEGPLTLWTATLTQAVKGLELSGDNAARAVAAIDAELGAPP
ncbi:MAG: hypothetical protein AAB227_02895 [Pseudomonadota bacterium]